MATMVIPYNELLSIGDHIILELHDGDIFEGDFVEGGTDRIDILNARQHNNPNDVLSGTYSLYRKEIRDIYKFKSSSLNQHQIKEEDTFKFIDMTQTEYEYLRSMTKNNIYLNKADSRYFHAIEHLTKVDCVGIAVLGMNESRVGILRLLVISTWLQVYLFDMNDMKNGTFYPELKTVFESQYITKVIYNAGPLVDILLKTYNVVTRNIFDPQVVDLVYQKNVSVESQNRTLQSKNLGECLTNYISFPVAFLQDAIAISKKKWCDRPLKNEYKIFAAQLCVYLIPLRMRLRNKLFSTAYKAIENVHNYSLHNFCQLTDAQFKKQVKDLTVNDIEKFIPNLLKQEDSDK